MTQDTILSLRFYYKGKNLDTAKEIRDIKDKFVIGSDKYIQWQILDKTFPKKHLLIKKAKDGFKLFLLKGMQLTVKKGNQILTEEALRSKNLLKRNELFLDKETTGYVTCARDWSIAYEYVKAHPKVLTEEDRRMIQTYHRRPPLTGQQKISRNSIILVILLTLIGAYLFEKFYTPPVYVRTLSHRVEIEPIIPEETLVFEERIMPEDIPVEEGEVDIVGVPGGARDILGFDPGDVSGPIAQIPKGTASITYSEQIVATGTGGGPGTGPGTDGPVSGGRAGESFSVGDVHQSSVTPGDIFRGDIDAVRDRISMRDIDPSILGGQTGDIEFTQITTTEQLNALARARRRALSEGIQTVDEQAIDTTPIGLREDAINIRQYVEPNIRQLHELFAKESQVRNIYGSIQVTLYFRPNGQVEGVNIDPRPGSFFTDSFIAQAVAIMMQWRVPTTRQLPAYSFQVRFIRN
ncbi:MAG: hypothetical protein K0B81_05105 [Candidatus Cloacimonetes bacterium]|nr:hypothetical protein [Candidatus Cloacimonadota bacterium]